MERGKILVFKTNLSTASRYLVAKWMLDRHPGIEKWTIDQDDCDNVLRIVGHTNLQEYAIISQIRSIGYLCKRLP